MDASFSYIHQSYTQLLDGKVLRHTLVQYRQAVRVLVGDSTKEGKALRKQLARAIALLEAELARRGSPKGAEASHIL